MTKSSVSQDESLLLPPEPREPCRKPAPSAGDVSVFWSCCCISPRDWGSQGRSLRLGPRTRGKPGLQVLTWGSALLPISSCVVYRQLGPTGTVPGRSHPAPRVPGETSPASPSVLQRPERAALHSGQKASHIYLRRGGEPSSAPQALAPQVCVCALSRSPPTHAEVPGTRAGLHSRTQDHPAPMPTRAQASTHRPTPSRPASGTRGLAVGAMSASPNSSCSDLPQPELLCPQLVRTAGILRA